MNQTKVFLLSTLLATSPMAESSDMPIREKRATEEQQSKYSTMTGLENFAGKFPNRLNLTWFGAAKKDPYILEMGPPWFLLVGPQGIGKTLLIKELVKLVDIPLLILNVGDCCAKEDEWFFSRTLDSTFQQAKNSISKENKHVIILLEHLDLVNLFRQPGFVTLNWGLLLSALSKVEENEKITILATAKNYDCIPGDIADRLGIRIILPFPNTQSRQDIFKFYLSKYPSQEDLDISKIIKQSKGFTGADIERAVKKASLSARIHEDKKITQDDFWKAFQSINEKVQLREGALKSPTNFFEKNGKIILMMVALAATAVLVALLASKLSKDKK